MNLTRESINEAIQRSSNFDSNIDPEIFNLNSPSGKMGRCLMNNLGRLFDNDLRYLEIGTERGTAYCCVMNGMMPKYSCVIDPWPNDWLKPDFDRNVGKFLPQLPYNKLDLFIEDCFSVSVSRIKEPINFYFYDAMHDFESQKRAFTYFDPALDEVFLTVVDDWNGPNARNGTLAAFTELKYDMLFGAQIPTEFWDKEGGSGNPHTYWNGLGIFLLRKTTTSKLKA